MDLIGKHYHYKKRAGGYQSVRIFQQIEGRIQIRLMWTDKREYIRYGRARWVKYTPTIQASIDDWPWFPGMKPKTSS